MSEAKSAQKSPRPDRELALAVLALFEVLVSTAVDRGDNVEALGDWSDEYKPRLESLLRGKTTIPSSAQSEP